MNPVTALTALLLASLGCITEPTEQRLRELLRRAAAACRAQHPDLRVLTVNASLHAQGIYQRLGFQPCGPACTVNGIAHMPMLMPMPMPMPMALALDQAPGAPGLQGDAARSC